MKITVITRTISGDSYDNISATAILDENENVIEAIKALDMTLKEGLAEIVFNKYVVENQTEEKNHTIGLLEEALKYAKDRDIPF